MSNIITQLATAYGRSASWAENCLEQQEKLGIRTMSSTDTDYPASFRLLPDAPKFIFVRGNMGALSLPGIAVIGTRQTCPYMQTVGEHVGGFVARNGFSVISGLALGCDGSAHRGCLAAGGVTVAIVATGLEQTYPSQHSTLQSQILANGGCLLSEYPLGFSLTVPHLIARDRLQSALARGVFVVGTGARGGSWHAIRHAARLNRPIAFFDYTQSRCNPVPHTDGMSKLRCYQASPVYSSASFRAFLGTCGAVRM